MLKPNRVRAAFREGRPSFGVYARIPSTATIELLAHAGLDFVRIDLLENHIGPEMLRAMIQTAHAEGITPFVRVPAVDPQAIRMVLDLGASGVIVPEVESAADVAAAVRAAKLPPHGARRVGLTGLDGHGRVAPDEYAAWASEHVLLGVQMETPGALRDMDAILAMPGLDMVLGGRGTLASHLGVPGQRDHPKVLEAEARLMERARQAGKIISVTYLPVRDPAQVEPVRDWVARGIHSVALGLDADFVHVYRRLLAAVAPAASGERQS
ncbi:MAG TPA: aldolase/citrate lyase family protein [bacterium]|nr:aldolase/citrate lyase family protein [bacterium]